MLPKIPNIASYGITSDRGFLSDETPLEALPDPYYAKWESVIRSLQPLILTRRLRQVIQKLPVLSTENLKEEAQWQRAYHVLSFLAHGYIWGGEVPEERVPPPISRPFKEVCQHLELPTVATYAGVCLWNWRPIFDEEEVDDLNNLATLTTFTGSLDESWFYLVSVAIEARGAPTIPIMLEAMSAARRGDSKTVVKALQFTAERIDEIGGLLSRMYEQCDPHVFYHKIRPFLAGSENMAEAGLPNGVLFDTGSGNDDYVHFGGGSNAQSSLIQFFDIILGIEHRPTGEGPAPSIGKQTPSGSSLPASKNNFISDMRRYMPGPHRRFLNDVSAAANIREYVNETRSDKALVLAYDACLAMLRSLRDKHIQMVSRYIIVKSRESRSVSPRQPTSARGRINLANMRQNSRGVKKAPKGTGGTALIPFLKQARDETGEGFVDLWAKRLLGDMPVATGQFEDDHAKFAVIKKFAEHENGQPLIVGMAGTWAIDDSEGGICHW